jgi:hypothetical protein
MNTMSMKSRTLLTAALAAVALGSVQALQAEQANIGKPLSKQAVLSVLTCKLDTKKSKAGDPVTAKTLNPLKLNDGTVLPRGTILTGKVTQVQAKSSGSAALAIVFDQLETTKGAVPMPVHGLLAAVAPAPSLSDAGGSTSDLPLGSGGDSKGQIAALTGTGFGGPDAPLPPIQPGCSIKGVVLSNIPAADGSSVLQSTDKDFRLENGTRLEIGLVAAN